LSLSPAVQLAQPAPTEIEPAALHRMAKSIAQLDIVPGEEIESV